MKKARPRTAGIPASWKDWRDLRSVNFLFLTVAGVVKAIGVTMFLFPVKLYDSGISGTSMLLDQITPEQLGLPLFLLILNVPVFLFGWRRQGAAFTVYSIYTIGVYALASYLIMHVLPIDVSFVSPLAGSDLLLCAIFGGAIDGVDVLSVVFAKRLGISLGTFVMIYNTTLYTICGCVIRSWILPLYSIVTYYVGAKTVDYIVEGFDRAKCAMIVTTRAEEISGALSHVFQVGGTIVSATGGYSGDSKQILYFVVNHFQINRLKRIVFEIDESAFISLQDVSDIIKTRGE